MTNHIAILSAIFVGAFMLSGCANTIRGVGADASNTVHATKGAVRDVAN